jgi:hypothetical protein
MLVITPRGTVTIFRGMIKTLDKLIFLTAVGRFDIVYSFDEIHYLKTGIVKNLIAL